MDEKDKAAWDGFVEGYKRTLSSAERDKISAVGSIDGLLRQVETLRGRYQASGAARYFERIGPFLEWLYGFNSCVQSFLQASPREFVLLWGSLSFVFEISLRYGRGLELLSETIDDIHNTLPRLTVYASKLSDATQDLFRDKLFKYHIELIGFCHDAILLFKKPLLRNLLSSSTRTFLRKCDQRLQRLRQLTSAIDKDVNAACTLLILERQDAHTRGLRTLTLCRKVDDMFIGAVPFHNLPMRENSSFFARGEELELIKKALNPGSASTKICCASLYGLGGTGKTQLALQFAYQHMNDYNAILWIKAETSLKVIQSFVAVSHGLQIVDEGMQSSEQKKNEVFHWLRSTSRGPPGHPIRWLMILDNAKDLSVLESCWPSAAKGSIIVTCRSPEIAERFAYKPEARVHVQPFTDNAATQFLLSLIDRRHNFSYKEGELALKLSNSVGNHPLALDVIGCYIRRCGLSLAEFILEHPSFERDLLFRPDLRAWSENPYQIHVDGALKLNLESTVYNRGLDPSSELLVQMLALLDVDGVPRHLFTGNSEHRMLCDGPDMLKEFPNIQEILENPFEDPSCLDNSIANLLDLALITINHSNSRLICHRLVRISVEKSMTPATINLTLDRLVFFLNASFPTQSDGTPLHSQWERCEELAGSITYALETYERHRQALAAPILLCEVICRCAWYYYEKGQYSVALDITDRAISICEEALAKASHAGYSEWFVRDMISHQLNTKATIQKEAPTADHGLDLSRQICWLRRRNRREGIAEDEKWIAAADGNLAVSLMSVGNLQQALGILLRLIERPDMQANRDIYLSNICLCLLNLGRLEEASVYSERAIEAVRRLRGEDTVQMAVVAYYISSICEKRGELSNSLTALEQCLRIRDQLMPGHLHTGLTLHRMGVLWSVAGEDHNALVSFMEAFDVLSKCECHPGAVCRTALTLAAAFKRQGDAAGTEKYLGFAQTYRRKVVEWEKKDYGDGPAGYDDFVTVGLR